MANSIRIQHLRGVTPGPVRGGEAGHPEVGSTGVMMVDGGRYSPTSEVLTIPGDLSTIAGILVIADQTSVRDNGASVTTEHLYADRLDAARIAGPDAPVMWGGGVYPPYDRPTEDKKWVQNTIELTDGQRNASGWIGDLPTSHSQLHNTEIQWTDSFGKVYAWQRWHAWSWLRPGAEATWRMNYPGTYFPRDPWRDGNGVRTDLPNLYLAQKVGFTNLRVDDPRNPPFPGQPFVIAYDAYGWSSDVWGPGMGAVQVFLFEEVDAVFPAWVGVDVPPDPTPDPGYPTEAELLHDIAVYGNSNTGARFQDPF